LPVCCPGISQTERHLGVAKYSLACDERCLLFIFFCHFSLVVTSVCIHKAFKRKSAKGFWNRIFKKRSKKKAKNKQIQARDGKDQVK
ncbi:hypothetical protein Tco_0197679, partial [Tanacetum coccineum]